MNKQTENLRNLTILHSNDIHADFLGSEIGEIHYGGAAKLTHYVESVREEKKDETLYFVAGDIFSGSALDKESKGDNSVAIMNRINPDAVTIGNHAVDHTLARLTWLEKTAAFPVINANMVVEATKRPIFKPYLEIEKNGVKILLIGVVTNALEDKAVKDKDIKQIKVRDPYEVIEEICESEEIKQKEYDLKIILSHIGYKDDKKLARKLKEDWGIDLIIGGHSHTLPPDLISVNGILIVQAGKKTTQIGRLDIQVDTQDHRICQCRTSWEIQKLNSETIKKNEAMKQMVKAKDAKVDELYRSKGIDPQKVIVQLQTHLTQEYRYVESNLGNFFADALRDKYDLDLVLVGSGSIRSELLEEKITYRNLREAYSMDEPFRKIMLKGSEIKNAVRTFLKKAPYDEEQEGEYFQISRGWKFHFDKNRSEEAGEDQLVEALVYDKEKEKWIEIEDDREFSVGIELFHYGQFEKRFGFPYDEKGRGVEDLTKSIFEEVREHLEVNKEAYEKMNPEVFGPEGRTSRVFDSEEA